MPLQTALIHDKYCQLSHYEYLESNKGEDEDKGEALDDGVMKL